MCIFVVAVLLLLGGYCDCDFGCVSVVFEDSVEFVGVDWVFGLAIGFSH